MTLWLASYAARLAISYLYPSNLYINLALDLLLASITGPKNAVYHFLIPFYMVPRSLLPSFEKACTFVFRYDSISVSLVRKNPFIISR